ncbi:hypothetical protein X777_11978 [Ooceraea biroi]|uniref:Secreted protein n=1 Tax=Ooceraea biroi TaxID=2015173 RepID=A0A026WZ16_OOCBI|nr:hypothetical protein X777_11978 [Ooceraea biroi]
MSNFIAILRRNLLITILFVTLQRDIVPRACPSPVPRAVSGKKGKERGKNAREKRTGMIGPRVVGVAPSMVGLFGPNVVCEREGERGDGRSAIEILSRSLGRGSWPRRVWLAPSVGPRRSGKPPLGPSNPRGRTREHDGKKKEKKKENERRERRRIREGIGKRGKKGKAHSGPEEDRLTRCCRGVFPLRSVHLWRGDAHDGEDVAEYMEDSFYLIAALAISCE